MNKVLITTGISGIIIQLFCINFFGLTALEGALSTGYLIFTIFVSFLIYLLTGFHKNDILRARTEEIIKAKEALKDEIRELAEDLQREIQPEASKQAERLLSLLEDFQTVIQNKLGDSAIAENSYMTSSSKVFDLVKNNLKDILSMDISIRTIEEEYDAGRRISEENKNLMDTQHEKIKQLIESNKDLLKSLNNISVEVANIKDIASFEYEQTLNRLKDLTERAKVYSKK